jgi:hypothetical protein
VKKRREKKTRFVHVVRTFAVPSVILTLPLCPTKSALTNAAVTTRSESRRSIFERSGREKGKGGEGRESGGKVPPRKM